MTASAPDSTLVLGEVDVRNDSASVPQKMRWLGRAFSKGLTFTSAKLRVIPAASLRNALLRLEPIDGVILSSVQFAGAFPDVFEERPFIYVAHNVEHRSAEENAEAAAGLIARMLYRREARLLKRMERRLCDSARFVFTFAEEDRGLLGVASKDRSAALPLVTRPAASAKRPRQPQFDAALIGTWTWNPNRIGLDWFLDEVVPLLPSDFSIAVAGRLPQGMAEKHSRVRFVGRVPDASAFMRRAKVAPLISRAGTGVQLKTIETFELGLPSVATTRSLRGIARIPRNCIRADKPKAFAAALEKLAARTDQDVDGRVFHRAQIRTLDHEVQRGLERLGFPRAEAAE